MLVTSEDPRAWMRPAGTTDALMQFLKDQWPDASDPLAIVASDFETVRTRHLHDVEQLAGAVIFGWYQLLSTATVKPGRLPP